MQSNFGYADSDPKLVKGQSETVRKSEYPLQQDFFTKTRTLPHIQAEKGLALAMDSGFDANDPDRSPTRFDWAKNRQLGRITEEEEGYSDHSGLPARSPPKRYVSEPPKYDERPKLNTELVQSSFGDEHEHSPPPQLKSVPPPELPDKRDGTTEKQRSGSEVHKYVLKQESNPAESILAPVTKESLGKFQTFIGNSFGKPSTTDQPPNQKGRTSRSQTVGDHSVASTDGHMSYERPIQIDEVIFCLLKKFYSMVMC